MGNSEEKVDLQRLSERELLILVYNKVKTLEKTSDEQSMKQANTDIQLAILKTKLQTWSAVIGFIAGLASSLIVVFLSK